MWKEALRAQEKGLIGSLYFSWHDDAKNLLKIIEKDKHLSGITLQYNLLDRSNERAMAMARRKKWGTVVMGPVGGGRLAEAGNLSRAFKGIKAKNAPEAAMRFVYSNPDVQVVISGMGDKKMVDQNVRAVNNLKPLGKGEMKAADRAAKKLSELAKLYCTSCNYCRPCPQKIRISQILNLLIQHRVYGQTGHAKGWYGMLGSPGWFQNHVKADVCSECGECEEKCPQNIPIIKRLKEAHKELS